MAMVEASWREVGSCMKPQQENKWSVEEEIELTEHYFQTQWPGIRLGAALSQGRTLELQFLSSESWRLSLSNFDLLALFIPEEYWISTVYMLLGLYERS